MTAPVSVGILGVGYWGRNYVRNLEQVGGCQLHSVCDKNPAALARITNQYPHLHVTDSFSSLLSDPELDAIVVATNSPYHYEHASQVLSAGKHVLVEKPMATSLADAQKLAAQVKQSGLVLMVGHLMAYHSAVAALKEMIVRGDVGNIYYIYASRVNLGKLRAEENALWSFGPHYLSIIRELVSSKPVTVAARGASYLQPGIEDVVFANIQFENGTMANIQLSWLDPHKERRLTVVGSKKMIVFDDTHATEKLRIYDKGFDRPPEYDSYGDYLSIRHGDVHIPHLNLLEPLTVECRHFVECIQQKRSPRNRC